MQVLRVVASDKPSMKFVAYRLEDGPTIPGVIEGDLIRRIDTPTMQAYIALEPEQRAARHTRETRPLRHARLDAPVHPLRNIFCVGRNYLEHAKEGAAIFGKELKLPEVPTFFTKATPTTIAANEQTLKLEARVSNEYDFEAELAVIIGTTCKDVREADAMSVIFGYTAFNDVTARDLQRAHLQWFKGKSLDDCSPYGPWIVSADEVGDPHALEITFRLNGVEKQHSNTSQMMFRIPRLIAELSKGMTLLPGDIIATGTPSGVGFARTPPEFLHDGDVMEVEIEKIGILRNTVSIS
jgi:2-keto-4-pentenoate hydratase/2-oxohepta-3-ene-1,7-dioic acid hydratase in catechol pathway